MRDFSCCALCYIFLWVEVVPPLRRKFALRKSHLVGDLVILHDDAGDLDGDLDLLIVGLRLPKETRDSSVIASNHMRIFPLPMPDATKSRVRGVQARPEWRLARA